MSKSKRQAKVREFGSLIVGKNNIMDISAMTGGLMDMKMEELTFHDALQLVNVYQTMLRALNNCQRNLFRLEDRIGSEGNEWQNVDFYAKERQSEVL